ncbi:hypothetical protein B0J11DRAFT_598475 [Dendryphion nanum]|uniref:Uncharacterized protein n=1 Tax=Dendryphion nanum TaxID=256645 RepID=A0A9P9D395_9PLEO|nr:hypothetical protein B0J11DRAFT_598475 [Dendryphion nanum]
MRFLLFTLFASLAATTPIVYGGARQDPLCPDYSCGVQGDEFNFLGQAVTNRSNNPNFATKEGCSFSSFSSGIMDLSHSIIGAASTRPKQICGLTGYPSIKAITEPDPGFGVNVTSCHEHYFAIPNCHGIFFYESSYGRGTFCDYSMNLSHIESVTPHHDPGFLYPYYFSRECINPHIRLSGKDDSDPSEESDPDSKLELESPDEGSLSSSIQSTGGESGTPGQNTGPGDKDSTMFHIDALLGPS